MRSLKQIVISNRKAAGWVCMFLFLYGTCSYAQQVNASIDRDSVKIGEQILYKIEVETREGDRVVFPQGQSFIPLEVIDSTVVDTFKTKTSFKLQKLFPLTQFDSGAYTIPRQTVIINDEGFYTDSFAVQVNDVVVDTTKQGLYPVKSALDVKTGIVIPRWLWWVMGIIVLAILVYFLWKTRKRIIEKKNNLPPYEKALKSLRELDESQRLEQGEVKTFYTLLIDTLKRYMDEKIDGGVLESTSDEFIELLRAYKKNKQIYLKDQVIDSLDIILKRADLVKFAGVKTDRLTAKEDRKTIEEDINAFDRAVPEPTEEEKLLNAAYRQEVERKKRNRRRAIRIGTAILAVLIVFSVFLGVKGIDYTKSLFVSHHTQKLLKKEWIKSEYGAMGMTVSTPDVLKRKADSTLSVFPDKADLEERFSDGNLKGRFYAQVTNVRFKEGTRLDSVDVGTLLDKELEGQGVDNVTFKNEAFKTLSNEKGQRIFGSFTVEDPLARSNRRKAYVFLIFAERGGLQELFISYDQGDETGKEIEERITNSVEFNKEHDG